VDYAANGPFAPPCRRLKRASYDAPRDHARLDNPAPTTPWVTTAPPVRGLAATAGEAVQGDLGPSSQRTATGQAKRVTGWRGGRPRSASREQPDPATRHAEAADRHRQAVAPVLERSAAVRRSRTPAPSRTARVPARRTRVPGQSARVQGRRTRVPGRSARVIRRSTRVIEGSTRVI
jgi:hypothetical protein